MGSSGSIDHSTRLSHRPIRGPEDGLDYPYTNYIARQMDALQQAKDVSEEAVKTYDLLYGRNRRKLISQRRSGRGLRTAACCHGRSRWRTRRAASYQRTRSRGQACSTSRKRC